ncbi:MAG: stage IV sporulation protein A [Clostridia bacterium]|nr:stage IV sporulation protein A [Clostridia bacterium]
MDQNALYRDIAGRCGGDIYIGVVGPVRTGKSSFIKRFMELMVLPNMEDEHSRERTRDELPQSAAGKTVMTNQPKFVPNDAIELHLKDASSARVRLVDCVGYLVPGALGTDEENSARMVRTPWFDHDIPFEEAAEIGTRKVIQDHSTIGVVVTTDGSIVDLPRSAYEAAEERAVGELRALGKPFIVLLNSTHPKDASTRSLEEALREKYAVPVISTDILNMGEGDVDNILESLLFEFPLREIRIQAPSWLTSLNGDHWLGKAVLDTVNDAAQNMRKLREHARVREAFAENEYAEDMNLSSIALNEGRVDYRLNMKDGLFYKILGEASGQEIEDEEHLFELMKKLVENSRAYEKVSAALQSVEQTGYGVVLPKVEEMELSVPELAKEGAHYGVRLKASAPSLHMIRVDLNTSVSPIVGAEKQSRELLENLTREYEKDPSELWSTEVFGKPLRDLVRDEMNIKLTHLPDDARSKLRSSMGRIINEGSGGMICILL